MCEQFVTPRIPKAKHLKATSTTTTTTTTDKQTNIFSLRLIMASSTLQPKQTVNVTAEAMAALPGRTNEQRSILGSDVEATTTTTTTATATTKTEAAQTLTAARARATATTANVRQRDLRSAEGGQEEAQSFKLPAALTCASTSGKSSSSTNITTHQQQLRQQQHWWATSFCTSPAHRRQQQQQQQQQHEQHLKLHRLNCCRPKVASLLKATTATITSATTTTKTTTLAAATTSAWPTVQCTFALALLFMAAMMPQCMVSAAQRDLNRIKEMKTILTSRANAIGHTHASSSGNSNNNNNLDSEHEHITGLHNYHVVNASLIEGSSNSTTTVSTMHNNNNNNPIVKHHGSSGGGGSGANRNAIDVDEPPTHIGDGPYFDPAASKNVTALLGKTAYLNCRVKNLGNRTMLMQVSWVRHRDIHLLTVGRYTYTSDQRFRAIHQPHTEDWILQIKYPQHRDSGIYECQISTTPHLSHYIHLNVVEPATEIIGAPDLYIESGSTINLTCVILNSPEPPAYIFWNHNNEIINYDSPRGGVSVVTNKGETTTSFLLIKTARPSDSGLYQCNPSNAKARSVTVHVLNGEFPAAMQHAVALQPHRVSMLQSLMVCCLWLYYSQQYATISATQRAK